VKSQPADYRSGCQASFTINWHLCVERITTEVSNQVKAEQEVYGQVLRNQSKDKTYQFLGSFDH
jgi:hypothetical protein